MSLGPSNRFRYYYEHILRYDLILKLNYKNVMQVPQICKVNILALPSAPFGPFGPLRVSLGLEIICGQTPSGAVAPFGAFGTISESGHLRKSASGPRLRRLTAVRKRSAIAEERRYGSARMAPLGTRSASRLKGPEGSAGRPRRGRRPRSISIAQSNTPLLFCSLHAQTMYNFLEKLMTIMTGSYDYKIQIQGQEVQITLSNREVRLFPEIQNHFEFFECFKTIQIKLVTSSSNEKETRLLWTGLHQKEI